MYASNKLTCKPPPTRPKTYSANEKASEGRLANASRGMAGDEAIIDDVMWTVMMMMMT